MKLRNVIGGSKRHERGMAVIAVLTIIAILMIYVAGNLGTLARLSHEMRLLEQQQTRRLARVHADRSSPPQTEPKTNSPQP